MSRFRMRLGLTLALPVLASAGCARPAARAPDGGGGNAPSATAAGAPALHLPDAIEGFAAGPETAGAGYVRRSYARGPALASVTLARTAIDDQAYARWVATS